MLSSCLEQFETLQQYLSCLFDSFDCIQIQRLRQRINEPLAGDTVRLLVSYGRKIMQLSQQSTYKHRNEHYLSRKEVEEEIFIIYRSITGEQTRQKYQKMIRVIIEKLQDERKSIWAKFSMPESRILPVDFKSQQKKQVVLEQEKNSNVRSSKAKVRASKVGSIKQVLRIKSYLQIEQDAIRDLFDKMNKIMQVHKIPVNSLESQALKFTRKLDQNSTEKVIDLIKLSTETHAKNISNLGALVEILNENLNRRLKNQGYAESRLSLYLEEAERMEEIYSYTLSKMLEKLSIAKQSMEEDASLCSSQLESLQEITRKLYGLYPSQQSLQSLTVKVKTHQGTKNYSTQVNMGKAQQERKTGSQAYRLQVRVSECLQKFEKNSKFRKTFQLKQLQKLFETIREILPVKLIKSQAEVAYQQEFKNLLELQDKKEKEFVESSIKKLKKSEKRTHQLQLTLQQVKKQAGSANEEWQQQRKKLQKRIEIEQAQGRKLSKQKSTLDSNLSQYIAEIENMREEVRRQGQESLRLRKTYERQNQQLREKHQSVSKKLKETIDQVRLEKQQIAEERSIYHRKIDLTENQLNEERGLAVGFRVELEVALSENRKLREQVSEMSRIYEEKIKELDGMIEHLRQIQKIKRSQQITIQQLQVDLQHHVDRSKNAQKDLEGHSSKVQVLLKENNSLLKQVEHWKEQGKLTDSDLKVLKDEVDKVSTAYIDSEEQLQMSKRELASCSEERDKLFREKLRLSRLIEDLESQVVALKTKQQATELAERDIKDEYYQAAQDLKRNQRELQELKKETAKVRKDLLEERQERAKSQKQLRELRQDSQSRKQSESLEQGKRRMELENLRVEVRRKSEQLEKQKQVYEQKLSLAQQKMKELQEFAGQKQLLSRLLQNHQSQ